VLSGTIEELFKSEGLERAAPPPPPAVGKLDKEVDEEEEEVDCKRRDIERATWSSPSIRASRIARRSETESMSVTSLSENGLESGAFFNKTI